MRLVVLIGWGRRSSLSGAAPELVRMILRDADEVMAQTRQPGI
ncbi:hypothetical protein [Nonomuraea sp. NPDC049646]